MLYSSDDVTRRRLVSMKSGLRDRNNPCTSPANRPVLAAVSMKSGLRDRNNRMRLDRRSHPSRVSMKSGLRDRNNGSPRKAVLTRNFTKVCERSAPQTPATPLC